MSWVLTVLVSILTIELVTGRTIGADQFHSLSGESSIPVGRWPRVVRRFEELAYYWVLIGCQVVLAALVWIVISLRPQRFGI